jgi:hypothetical protein
MKRETVFQSYQTQTSITNTTDMNIHGELENKTYRSHWVNPTAHVAKETSTKRIIAGDQTYR